MNKPLCELTHLEALAQVEKLQAVAVGMSAVLDNLCVQLWGPPHPDADYPRHWTDLPAKLAEEQAADAQTISRMSEMLTRVAAGLKGPPEPLTMFDWADLPELAAAAREDTERWRTVRQDRADLYVVVRDALGLVDTFAGADLDAVIDTLRREAAALETQARAQRP